MPDVEHRTEIRRANRTTPIWIGLLVLVAVVVIAVGNQDDGPAEEDGLRPPTSAPTTPTSETLTTTSPRRLPPVHGLTETQRGLLPFSTAVAPAADSPSGRPHEIDVVGGPIVTGDRVVVLDATGALGAGEAGTSFGFAGCCWEEIHSSNESDHVWGRALDLVELVYLDRSEPDRRVTLEIGEEARVLGPASFGVVTVDEDGIVRWHRPSFEPTVVHLPPDRVPLDSGGERLLVVAPDTAGTSRLETWSIAGNGLLASFVLADGASPEGVLAPDGSVLAVAAPGGWEVRHAATGRLHGTLPEVERPVWVGGPRFAAVLDGGLVVSDSGALPLRWPVLAVAERSP